MTPIEIRHHLHQHPELSGKEVETQRFILSQLKECHPTSIYSELGEGNHGIIAVWGDDKQAPTIAFRADIDALPIQEANLLPYGSTRKGVAHKCGHDGHTAILLALAQKLDEEQPSCNIMLLFQPAEETGYGAKAMVESGIMQQYNIQAVYGVHNLPGYPKNTVLLKEGTFACASEGLLIRLQGRQTHASTPEMGINPALAVSELIPRLTQFNHCDNQFILLSTLVYTKIGEKAFGTSAGYAEIGITVRAHNDNTLQQVLRQIDSDCIEMAEKHHLGLSTSVFDPFGATINTPSAIQTLTEVCQSSERTTALLERPFRWSEDFCEYLRLYEGALFGIGAGESCKELHHPEYDFTDDIIAPTAQLFYQLATHFANTHH